MKSIIQLDSVSQKNQNRKNKIKVRKPSIELNLITNHIRKWHFSFRIVQKLKTMK